MKRRHEYETGISELLSWPRPIKEETHTRTNERKREKKIKINSECVCT